MGRRTNIETHQTGLSRSGRLLILGTVFLGWLFAGLVMVIIPLAGRSAIVSFLGAGRETDVGHWFSVFICAFLLGGAAGGLLFGWLGDRVGRARAMGLSILCYASLTGLTAWAQDPWQLMVLRFLACLGVGGMWPKLGPSGCVPAAGLSGRCSAAGWPAALAAGRPTSWSVSAH